MVVGLANESPGRARDPSAHWFGVIPGVCHLVVILTSSFCSTVRGSSSGSQLGRGIGGNVFAVQWCVWGLLSCNRWDGGLLLHTLLSAYRVQLSLTPLNPPATPVGTSQVLQPRSLHPNSELLVGDTGC